MSIVKISAITVPEDVGEELERRFSANSSKMTDVPNSIDFQLLCPTTGESRYFVSTGWGSEETHQGWREGRAFKASHESEEHEPVLSSAELLEFDVVLDAKT